MTPSQTQTFKAGDITVPEQLRVIPNWVSWRLVQKENGKTTKVPFICGTDLHASSTDPSTWVDFETAIRNCTKIDNTQGIGFVIHHVAGKAGFVGFDTDGCRNPETGEIAAWARELINILDSYTEVTPSQTGVRVWVVGRLPDGDRVFNLNMGVGYGEKVKIEIYDRGRFFTVTGNEVGDFPCDIATRDLAGAYQLCHKLRDRFPVNEPKSAASATSDETISVSSVQIKSGTAFTSKLGLLMNGEVISTSPFVVQDDQGNSLEYPSHSEADLALATALAFEYGDNPEKIADEFAKSPLYREKWNRDDYSLRTIAKAIKTALAAETLTTTQAVPVAEPWVDPQPLDAPLLPVQPFKLEFLPSSLQIWAKDVAERMSVPLDFAGACILSSLAGCVNRRAFVYPKQHDKTWKEAISVSGAIVANSGRKKTPTFKTMINSMYEIEGDWQVEYQDRLGIYESELKIYEDAEKQREKASKKDESDAGPLFNSTKPRPSSAAPVEPAPRRRLIVNDSTPESMHRIMSDNPEGLFCYRDELSGWVSELEQQGRESERTMFLAAMNGNDPHTLDRIGRGSITSTMSASLFGGFQPDLLVEFLGNKRNQSDGLVARFGLLVWPDFSPIVRIDRAPDEVAMLAFRRVLRTLANFKAESFSLSFSPDAQPIFNDWLDRHALKVERQSNEAKRSHLSKYDGLLAKLSGLLQLVDIASTISDLDGGHYLIDSDHLNRAIALLAYLESHMNRVYGSVKSPEQLAEAALAEHIKDGSLKDGFTIYDVERPCWKGLSKTYATGAVYSLEHLGWLRLLPADNKGKRGRPTNRWEINPKLKQSELKQMAA